MASAVAMDKPMAKRVLAQAGVPVAEGIVVSSAQLADFHIPFAPPYVIKPADEGSSFGVHIVRPGDNKNLHDLSFGDSKKLLIERYVPGRELTIGVKGLSGESAAGMPITEIRLQGEIYGYDTKYADGYHIIPCDIPGDIRAEVTRLGILAHETLGCSGITRSDFRWDDTQPGVTGLYFLEINTQPGMTPFSLVPEQAGHLGISFPELVSWLVEGARCHA
jgi:D-alanine-D-alanine ligase